MKNISLLLATIFILLFSIYVYQKDESYIIYGFLSLFNYVSYQADKIIEHVKELEKKIKP